MGSKTSLNICVSEKIRVADVFGVIERITKTVKIKFHLVQIEIVTAFKFVRNLMVFSNLNNHSSPPYKAGSEVINMRFGVI